MFLNVFMCLTVCLELLCYNQVGKVDFGCKYEGPDSRVLMSSQLRRKLGSLKQGVAMQHVHTKKRSDAFVESFFGIGETFQLYICVLALWFDT